MKNCTLTKHSKICFRTPSSAKIEVSGEPGADLDVFLRDILTFSHAELWMCGMWVEAGDWRVVGIYASEFVAARACVNIDYFIAPLTLNEHQAFTIGTMPGAYFPKEVKNK